MAAHTTPTAPLGRVGPPPRSVQAVPWIVALACVAVLLVAAGFVVWPLVLAWLCLLGGIFVVARLLRPDRRARIVLALVALPLLVVTAFEGGWYLIPSVVALLAIDGWAAARGIPDRPDDP